MLLLVGPLFAVLLLVGPLFAVLLLTLLVVLLFVVFFVPLLLAPAFGFGEVVVSFFSTNGEPPINVFCKISSAFSTGTISKTLKILEGTSSRSFSFSLGIKTVLIPPRLAARSFSLSPPIGKTRPRRVISPVMATSLRTGNPLMALTSPVTMVTPADGPSFGIAPSGK